MNAQPAIHRAKALARQVFINLPVASLPRSVAFFDALGFGFCDRYADDNASCLVLGENIFVMLLATPFFEGFTDKPVGDARQCATVINALSLDSRAEVDALVARARAAGARISGEPRDDGFIYQHGFEDPDGHLWEVFHGAGDAS